MTAMDIVRAIAVAMVGVPLLIAGLHLYQLARLQRSSPAPRTGNTARLRARSVVVEDAIALDDQAWIDESADLPTDEIPAIGLGLHTLTPRETQ